MLLSLSTMKLSSVQFNFINNSKNKNRCGEKKDSYGRRKDTSVWTMRNTAAKNVRHEANVRRPAVLAGQLTPRPLLEESLNNGWQEAQIWRRSSFPSSNLCFMLIAAHARQALNILEDSRKYCTLKAKFIDFGGTMSHSVWRKIVSKTLHVQRKWRKQCMNCTLWHMGVDYGVLTCGYSITYIGKCTLWHMRVDYGVLTWGYSIT